MGHGVLTRAELTGDLAHPNWPDHGSNAALRRGVNEGAIKELDNGLLEVGTDVPDLDEGRFDPT